ncbi:MAG: LAGLIDADG family homing endonuclease [Mollicutes bacterium]|nr:LAGLIDADG family homing endonuclease [Mollicutes bacterium]
MELLKGLMDGDGCASTDGAVIFTTCSNKLAQGIMLLVRSLGIKCWL